MCKNQEVIDVLKTSFKKLAIFYGVNEDEIRSECWLIQNEFPEAQTNYSFLLRKIRNRLIQANSSCGLSNRGAVSSMDSSDRYSDGQCDVGENFKLMLLVELKLQSDSARSGDPLAILIGREEEADRAAKIEALPSIDKARLAALETCRNGKDFGLNSSIKVKKRQSNEIIKSWIEEDKSKRQPDFFN